MRNLTAEEWVVVSGGHPSESGHEMQEVTVNGKRIRLRDPFSSMPLWFASYWSHSPLKPAGYDYSDGGWDPNESPDENGDIPDTVRDVSCVTDKPTKHGYIDIFQAAIQLKEMMPFHHSVDPNKKFEYFGVVYKMPGGGVQVTIPETSSKEREIKPETVWKVLDTIPNGAIILGIFHSQPDSGIMSPTDWNAYKMFFNDPDSPRFLGKPGSFAISDSIGRGITADPNGLSFVYDMKTGKIHVYDKSDTDSDKEQCQINNIRGSR